jgi:recombination protein RecT
MSNQSVSAEVAKVDNGPGAMVEAYRADLAMVMPSHVKPEMFVRLAVGVLRRDKNLAIAAQNNPAALMGALMDAAQLGLTPGTEQFYLVPRKANGRMEIQGIRGYQGEIELIYRAGAVSSVIVEVVRTGDTFRYSPGRDERPVHDIDWDADDRGDLRLVYAYAVMKDGATSKVVVLNKRDIARAKSSSQGSNSAYSPWKNHEEAMWMKTAAHRLTKWVPTSAEYMREQLRAQAAVAAETGQTVPVPAGFAPQAPAGAAPEHDDEGPIDAEFVDDDEEIRRPAPPRTAQRPRPAARGDDLHSWDIHQIAQSLGMSPGDLEERCYGVTGGPLADASEAQVRSLTQELANEMVTRDNRERATGGAS